MLSVIAIAVTLLHDRDRRVCVFPLFPLSLCIAFLLGGLDAVGETLRMTVIQLLTPDELRGRVQGVVRVFVFGVPALGNAQIGALAVLLGVPGAVAVGGLIGTVAVAWVANKAPKLRRFEI